jgi:carbon-monoxide dehydrogenase large subunit
MRADNVSNVGARAVSFSPLGKGSALVTGNYDIPVARVRSRAVFTNTVPTQAYRSSGPARGHLRDRAADRPRGREDGHRSPRAAPPQPDR